MNGHINFNFVNSIFFKFKLLTIEFIKKLWLLGQRRFPRPRCQFMFDHLIVTITMSMYSGTGNSAKIEQKKYD